MYMLLLLLCSSMYVAAQSNLVYTITHDDITLQAHIMPPQESSNTFLHNLHTYQVCPLQLVITNNTSKRFMISGNSIEELALVQPNTITGSIIYKNQTAATLSAYACALTGSLAFFTGFGAVEQSLPAFAQTTKWLTSAIAFMTFIYQAHRFATRLSKHYTLTQANIMRYGLSGSNIIIDPNTTATFVMFLNKKSYAQPPTTLDTFYYLFSLKFYNLYDSTDIITIPVEVPKIYLSNP